MLLGALLLAPLAGGAAPSAPVMQERRARWYADLEEGQRAARRAGKHVLVDFSGAGWSEPSRNFERAILGRTEFEDGVDGGFVLVRLDFDADLRAREDLPHAARNDALRRRLGIEVLPTLVLMTAEGQPYQSFGPEHLDAGGDPSRVASAFTRRLVQAQARAASLERAVPEILGAVVRARGADEASAAADEAIDLLAGAGEHPLARPLVPLVQRALEVSGIEPERERAAVGALAAAAVVDDALIARALRLDPANAAGLPEAALAGAFRGPLETRRVPELVARAEALMAGAPVFDRARAARLYADAASRAREQLEDAGRAARFARFALALEPEDRALRTMLESLAGG